MPLLVATVMVLVMVMVMVMAVLMLFVAYYCSAIPLSSALQARPRKNTALLWSHRLTTRVTGTGRGRRVVAICLYTGDNASLSFLPAKGSARCCGGGEGFGYYEGCPKTGDSGNKTDRSLTVLFTSLVREVSSLCQSKWMFGFLKTSD